MTIHDYTDIGLRILMVGLVAFPGVRFGVKPLLRLWIKRDGIVTRSELDAYRWITRASAPLIGLLLGMHPDLMPEWMPGLWSVICGTVGGSLAVVIHHSVEAALPAAVARLLTGAGLDPGGGRVVQPGPMPYSPTEVDTLTTRDVTEPLEDTDELKTTEER